VGRDSGEELRQLVCRPVRRVIHEVYAIARMTRVWL
jgi:hypothetical protein